MVDGDTLTKLAARYLRPRSGTRRSSRANRGLLVKPDLLPIGAVLTIPPAEGARGIRRFFNPQPARPPRPSDPLVPVLDRRLGAGSDGCLGRTGRK